MYYIIVGHEYAVDDLDFALHVDPENEAVKVCLQTRLGDTHCTSNNLNQIIVPLLYAFSILEILHILFPFSIQNRLEWAKQRRKDRLCTVRIKLLVLKRE